MDIRSCAFGEYQAGTPAHRFCTCGDFRFYTSRGRACPHLSDSPCSTCPAGCNWMSLSWGRWGTSCSAAVCCTAQSPSLRKCLKRRNAIDFYSIDISTYFSTFKSDTVSNIVIHMCGMSKSFIIYLLSEGYTTPSSTCFLSELLGLGFREWGDLVAFGVWTGVLKAAKVHALAVNHQVRQLPGHFGFCFRLLQRGSIKM